MGCSFQFGRDLDAEVWGMVHVLEDGPTKAIHEGCLRFGGHDVALLRIKTYPLLISPLFKIVEVSL